MDRSVAQTLNGLVPTLSGPLPVELVELAVSLLAQSRSKASSLKADEEIARSYACANLACERLKQTLALPKIEPRPPCPPKVYQKLYRYLDSALPARSRRSARTLRPDSTSTPTSSPAKLRTPATPSRPKTTTQRTTPRKLIATTSEVPAWIMPSIRQLCKKMSAPAAPHHIFAGVSSILASQEANSKAKATKQATPVKTSALIVAVYLFVTTRLAGVQTRPDDYRRQKDHALEILRNAAGGDPEEKNVDNGDVDMCAREIRDQKWTEMDWFANVPMGAGVGVEVDDGLDDAQPEGSVDGEAEEVHLLPMKRSKSGKAESADRDYLLPGLGTMMQDRVDYLSDERRRDYQEWKEGILIQIQELEKSNGMDAEAG